MVALGNNYKNIATRYILDTVIEDREWIFTNKKGTVLSLEDDLDPDFQEPTEQIHLNVLTLL